MRISFLLLVIAVVSSCTPQTKDAPPPPRKEEELAAARAVFLANIKAIQDRNKEEYLDCYRDDSLLVRAGVDGVKKGYADFAKDAPSTGSTDWPEKLEAKNVEVHWIAPGVVYGAYQYRVIIKGKETTGLSERVLLRQGEMWKVAVTTAFERPQDDAPDTESTAKEPTPAKDSKD